MSAPSDNMPENMAAATAIARPRPLLLRHLPYFIAAAILVALAASMQFDGYILNILMQAATFAIAVWRRPRSSASAPMPSALALPTCI
jgi:branched-chain amino acid transport system permease protein